MSHDLVQCLVPGSLLLIKLQSMGILWFQKQKAAEPVEGELALQVDECGGGGAQVSVAWLGLSSQGPPAWKEEIGRVSVGAVRTGRGTLCVTQEGLELELAFSAGLSRSSAASAVDSESEVDGDIGPSPREPYRVRVRGTIEGNPEAKSWAFNTNSFVFTPFPESSARLDRLRLRPGKSVLWRLDSRPRRRLKVRCVQISAQENCSDLTGDPWPDQLATAQRIWRKCCIEIEALPDPACLVNGDLMTTSDVGAVYPKLPSRPNGVIDVAFVRNELQRKGGGYTFLGGSANAAVILSDMTANPYLLAHELGHVLNLCHPSCSTEGFAGSEMGTVMDELPNNANNSATNCQGIWNDALDSLV